MIKNILFEVLPIASYTFFPPVCQLVDTSVQLRYNSGINPIQFRYYSGTIPVLFRYNSGTIPVLFRYYSGTIPVFSRCYSGIFPVPFRYFSGAIPVFFRYFYILVLFRYFSGTIPVFFRCYSDGNIKNTQNIHYEYSLRRTILINYKSIGREQKCNLHVFNKF